MYLSRIILMNSYSLHISPAKVFEYRAKLIIG